MSVRIETNVGDFVVDLYVRDAPQAACNFLKLCRIDYYAYSIFLRCEPGFILQGGDPSNTGHGGASIWHLLDTAGKTPRFFPDEIDTKKRRHAVRGTLSMASAGRDRNASQFFIALADDLDFLDETCTIFGHLTAFKRRAVQDATVDGTLASADNDDFFNLFNEEVFCDEQFRPLQDVYIKRTIVLSDPFPDPDGLDRLRRDGPQPTEAFLKHRRIGAEESLDDMAGRTEEEIAAAQREQSAKGHALVLEILGDLPSADVKPPENVLFICKLNPVTRSEDLRLIFSRFGTIQSCEVIRDRDTGNSLGYAFVEFEEQAACEQAYLKMDNVLIDDRRIKVDFSQSVAKLHRRWEEGQRRLRAKKASSASEGPNQERHERDLRNGHCRDERREPRDERREPRDERREPRDEHRQRDDYRHSDRSRHESHHRSRDRSRSRSRSRRR